MALEHDPNQLELFAQKPMRRRAKHNVRTGSYRVVIKKVVRRKEIDYDKLTFALLRTLEQMSPAERKVLAKKAKQRRKPEADSKRAA